MWEMAVPSRTLGILDIHSSILHSCMISSSSLNPRIYMTQDPLIMLGTDSSAHIQPTVGDPITV